MSTRSAIARIGRKGTGWAGIYCHWDGYPTARGKEIWEVLHKDFIGNKGETGIKNSGDPENAIEAFLKIYVDGHPGGWSNFPTKCFCHDPQFVMRDGAGSMPVTSEKNDPLFIEWVYILDPKAKTMTILSSDVKSKKVRKLADKTIVRKDGKTDYGHCIAWHKEAAVIDLTGEEPDWKKIESSS